MSVLLPVPSAAASVPTTLEHELASAGDYAAAEKSEATRLAYASDLEHFGAWCRTRGIHPLPCPVPGVCAYLAACADSGLSASTVDRRAAAIAYWHRAHGHEPPTNAAPARAVIRGIRRTLGTAQVQKAPATAAIVAKMVKRCPDSLIGIRDRALLLLGFAAALRRSELVALDVSDLVLSHEGVMVRIRRSKTDQEGAGHEVAVPRGSKLRPVEAVETWMAAAAIADGPLFRSIRKGGALGGRLSDRSVALVVKHYAAAAKLDASEFAGHSLRAGFVTSALEAGADVLRVMDVTRHKDVKVLKVYDRRARAFRNHAGKGFL